MNAFRILSRSTKLPRNKQAAADKRIPSTGRATDPRLFGTNEGPALKKQKREQGRHEHDDDALDFFKTLDTKTSASKDAVGSSRSTAKPQQPCPADVQDEDEDDEPQLDEAECRKILKTHKIKITPLWQPSSVSSKKEKKKRKRKDVEEAAQNNKPKQDIIMQPVTAFARLSARYKVHRRIVQNLVEQGYTTPTEVQMASLPLLLGKPGTTTLAESNPVDLLSVAPTGSGKTLAFLIPVLNDIKQRRAEQAGKPAGPEALVVAPTKELAGQIVNEARKLAQNTGVKITLLKKGMKLESARAGKELKADDDSEDAAASADSALEQSDDEETRPAQTIVKSSVLVSTPGTLLQALTASDGTVPDSSTLRHIVFDEADVLLDPLFRDQTLAIWNACTNPELRVTLWSATMGASIEDLAQEQLAARWTNLSPVSQSDHSRAPLVRVIVGLKDSAVPNIHHKMIYAATEQGKLLGLRQLLRPTAASSDQGPRLRPPFIVFTQTIERAVALHSELKFDIPAEAGGSGRIAVLHSDLSESARDKIMTRFRKGEIWVLITTDLLSRGVDFRGVNGVVNYDFPNSSAAYIHRVGRTGRAGRAGGVAVTLYAEEDVPYVKNVANVIAAADRLRTGGQVDDMTRWLVESLPKVTKQDKQKLKKHGVESRRPGRDKDENGRGSAKNRISTKSGFERREANRKKGAIAASKARALDGAESGSQGSENDEE